MKERTGKRVVYCTRGVLSRSRHGVHGVVHITAKTQCAMCNVQCAMCNVQCTMQNAKCKCTMQNAKHTQRSQDAQQHQGRHKRHSVSSSRGGCCRTCSDGTRASSCSCPARSPCSRARDTRCRACRSTRGHRSTSCLPRTRGVMECDVV